MAVEVGGCGRGERWGGGGRPWEEGIGRGEVGDQGRGRSRRISTAMEEGRRIIQPPSTTSVILTIYISMSVRFVPF